ncbi:hypothetical protein SO694_0016308 [Aureococcus anophagefferens]|uniref:Deacetylase sirtuin-type domain-containing protein n=1 Tax=Aureococcus anophagefferens TaxID=44056 RepID=A0ABR1G5R2_AURAN
MKVSKKSKEWVADTAHRDCDAPGSWYCTGNYPPALEPLINRRIDFAQLEDFNKKRDGHADEYVAAYMARMEGRAPAEGGGYKPPKYFEIADDYDEDDYVEDDGVAPLEEFDAGGRRGRRPSDYAARAAEAQAADWKAWSNNEDTTRMWSLISSGRYDELAAWIQASPPVVQMRAQDGRAPLRTLEAMEERCRRPKRKASRVVDDEEEESCSLDDAARLVADAARVLVVSGSGISAAAGLSTYVNGGVYERARKKYKLKSGIELFNYGFYASRPRDCQAFLARLAEAVASASRADAARRFAALENSGALLRHVTMNRRAARRRRRRPAARHRLRVLLYGDEEHAAIVDGAGALGVLRADAANADLVLWLGVSLEQSASCEYLRLVEAALGGAPTPQLLVNPDAEAAFAARSSLASPADVDLRAPVAGGAGASPNTVDAQKEAKARAEAMVKAAAKARAEAEAEAKKQAEALEEEAAARAKARAEAEAKEKKAAEERAAAEAKARAKAEAEAAARAKARAEAEAKEKAAAEARAKAEAEAAAQAKGLTAAVAIKQAKDQAEAAADATKKAEAAVAAEAKAAVAAEAASRESKAASKRAEEEATILFDLKRKASALEKDAKAAGATIPDLDAPPPKKAKPSAKKGKKSAARAATPPTDARVPPRGTAPRRPLPPNRASRDPPP